MSMDVQPVGPTDRREPATSPESAPPAPPGPRTGAFGALRTRWLLLWAGAGAVGTLVLFEVVRALGIPVSDELLGVLLYLPVVAWIWFMVVRRGGVRLGAMLRWPRLGTYWFVVAGLLVLQFMFSLAAITLTELVAPWMDDSLEGVGQGNLLLALIGIAILPPLVEEITFRGILLERFAVKWRVGVAVIVSAVLFGILHADPVGAGMFGIVTGLLYLRTGSLWPGIIIHFVNNVVALLAIRIAGPETAAQTPTLSESLQTAGLFLLLSVPFLAWFIRTHWPARESLTPYQGYEERVGLLARTYESVLWSGAASPVRVEITSTHVVVSDPATAPIAILPLDRVGSVYTSTGPVGTRVVILLHDGSWTTMQVPPGEPVANGELALTLRERAQGMGRLTSNAGAVANG
jgi:membrane protease YdiL (CAAX protease family)